MDAERRNRQFWDKDADAYQDRHGGRLQHTARAWGVWRIPEDELHVLGDIEGRDVLELGCGAAQWSVALAADGARTTGVDQSRAQLTHARDAVDHAGVAVSLLLASATAVPIADQSFDIVFCDHGAMSFCDPAQSVPEVARLLRPGGLLAFSAATPLVYFTYDEVRDRQTRRLRNRAFGRREWSGDDGTSDFCVPTGEWLRRFHAHGLVPEDLIELRAPKGATTTFADYVPYRWARRWPAEQIWKVRKQS
ncbi:MAG TPA: class I SAM-dependent methyltransferase [Acidimicrobiia bacterium]|nr:class I SAM-dependent methyltransferase [Acidimicrobiia bacterium]